MRPSHAVSRVLVVVPTYEERATLGDVVSAALAADPRIHVLVVDDASPDGTGAVAERLAVTNPRVTVRHRAAKRGLGSAYRYGLGRGLAEGFDAVGQMDADGSHDPRQLPDLLAALDHGAEVAIGSRYVSGGSVEGWPLARLLLSRGGNRYVRVLTGCPLRDATSGFRLYRRQALERVSLGRLASDGYCFQVEAALWLWQEGCAIREVPVSFRQRAAGASKLSPAIVAEAVWRIPRWALAIRGRRATRPRVRARRETRPRVDRGR